jgi:hypothetical protein
VGHLDRLEHASYAPASVQLPERYAQYKPQISGGYSYEESPEMTAAAGKLKQSVLAGRTAPSMTSPDNFGKTAALDLTGTADPRTDAAFSTGAPNRMTLGAPPAPQLPSIDGSRRKQFANMTRRRAQIQAFESQHPGWTVDRSGQVVRRA